MTTRVLAITGIRSEYFAQRPIFHAIMNHPALRLELVVTGAHLSPLHGYTVDQIEADGFPIIERIESLLYSDRDAGRLKGAASQLQVLSHIVDARRPDWLFAPADREEAMTLALCGAYLNIPTAHYGAGDRVVGNVDDMVRHAVSRLSHLLLTTHEEAKERLIRTGEQEWRVHNVGYAGLDRLRGTPMMAPHELAQVLGVEEIEDPYLVVVQHPLSSENEQAGLQMRETLAAVHDLGMQTFVSYPNSDAGAQGMIAAIEGHRSDPRIHVFRNVPDVPFVNLLRGATVLLGNSSLGLFEAPYLGLPAINIGNRQTARQHAGNVCFVPHERAAIVEQVRTIVRDKRSQASSRTYPQPFGDGHTGERIANLLATVPRDPRLLKKDLAF